MRLQYNRAVRKAKPTDSCVFTSLCVSISPSAAGQSMFRNLLPFLSQSLPTNVTLSSIQIHLFVISGWIETFHSIRNIPTFNGWRHRGQDSKDSKTYFRLKESISLFARFLFATRQPVWAVTYGARLHQFWRHGCRLLHYCWWPWLPSPPQD